jgi:hypothetical protein
MHVCACAPPPVDVTPIVPQIRTATRPTGGVAVAKGVEMPEAAPAAIVQAAALLADNRRRRGHLGPLPATCRPATEEAGYRVQFALREHLRAAGYRTLALSPSSQEVPWRCSRSPPLPMALQETG